jgi:hypothetical protein
LLPSDFAVEAVEMQGIEQFPIEIFVIAVPSETAA